MALWPFCPQCQGEVDAVEAVQKEHHNILSEVSEISTKYDSSHTAWNRSKGPELAKVRFKSEVHQCWEELGSGSPRENSFIVQVWTDSFWPSLWVAGTSHHFYLFICLTWAVNTRCACLDNLNLSWCIEQRFQLGTPLVLAEGSAFVPYLLWADFYNPSHWDNFIF